MHEEKGAAINMVNQLCDKLAKAKPGSESVIAVFCDVRSFSDFSAKVGSWNTATFLKYFYLKLLQDYFKNAAFAKPNGDGLLMVFQHDEVNLPEVSSDILKNCYKVLNDFPTMFKDLPLINYSTPPAIGFGIARGPVSYLALGSEKLDYSGDLLNLAARLTELARPKGIVIDGNYQMGIIPEELQKQFKSSLVFIRGIAEEVPIEVFYADSVVSLPAESLHPIKFHTWKKKEETLKASDLPFMPGTFVIRLPEEHLGNDKVRVFQKWLNKRVPNTYQGCQIVSFRVRHGAEGHEVVIDLAEVNAWVKTYGFGADEHVTLIVEYVPKHHAPRPKKTRRKAGG